MSDDFVACLGVHPQTMRKVSPHQSAACREAGADRIGDILRIESGQLAHGFTDDG